jgi:hypothetical protein
VIWLALAICLVNLVALGGSVVHYVHPPKADVMIQQYVRCFDATTVHFQ